MFLMSRSCKSSNKTPLNWWTATISGVLVQARDLPWEPPPIGRQTTHQRIYRFYGEFSNGKCGFKQVVWDARNTFFCGFWCPNMGGWNNTLGGLGGANMGTYRGIDPLVVRVCNIDYVPVKCRPSELPSCAQEGHQCWRKHIYVALFISVHNGHTAN